MPREKQRQPELEMYGADIISLIQEGVERALARPKAAQVSFAFESELPTPPAHRHDSPAPRPPQQRRRNTTGRNQQINIKASSETIERFYAQADSRGLKLAEAFELAVKLLEGQKR